MMRPLRKRHLQAWYLLALLIPAGIFSASMAVQAPVLTRTAAASKKDALPVVRAVKKAAGYSASIRCSPDGHRVQLEWICYEPIVQPSSLLYIETQHGRELLGRIGEAGTYYFPLKADTGSRYRFFVYDIIHHLTTDSLQF